MNFTYNNSNKNCNFASYYSRNSKQNVDYSMVLGKPSSITYGKPVVNTSYSSRILRIRTLLSRHGTIRTPAPPQAPAHPSFDGTFKVVNETAPGSVSRYIDAYLAYNDNAITQTARINGDNEYIFTINDIIHRDINGVPLPTSTLQLKVTLQSGTQRLFSTDYDGFTMTGKTNRPLNQENTLSMLVNENNYDNGECSIAFLVFYVPP
jgi:hypothetical protein